MSGDDEANYELVMPFVAVASQGGPFDDNAYTAGWEAARIDCALRECADVVLVAETFAKFGAGLRATVSSDNVPQLDLVAMRRGWTMVAEDASDGWSHVEFSRAGE